MEDVVTSTVTLQLPLFSPFASGNKFSVLDLRFDNRDLLWKEGCTCKV